MTLTLSDLDRWDPDAIHSVFQAAIDRATGTRSAATHVGAVINALPMEGAAHDAAVQATGRINADLLNHAEECDAVGRAAAAAEAQLRDIRNEWHNVQRMADRWGISINVESGELSYIPPTDPAQRAEMEHRVDIIEKEIQALLSRANDVDAELAGAIRVAAGDESAQELDQQLKDRPPVPMTAEDGNADYQQILDGHLSPEASARLNAATNLTPDQLAALQRGQLVLPAEQLAYLTSLSKSFGDKPPAEIKAIMDRLGPQGGRIADAFQIASNPNIAAAPPPPGKTGLPVRGDISALPTGIQRVLNSPALQEFWSPPGGIPGAPGNNGLPRPGQGPTPFKPPAPPQPIAVPQPGSGLGDLAGIVDAGNHRLQQGSGLDEGLMTKSKELLHGSQTATMPLFPDGTIPDRPHWYHDNVDPTLQHMMNSVSPDSMVVHDAVTGAGGQQFLKDLNTHQWQDNGTAAGNLFNTVRTDAVVTNPGDPTQEIVATRAGETAHAAAAFLGNPDNHLLNFDGTHNSLGQVNPNLTRAYAQALSPYIDDMMNNPLDQTRGFAPLDDPAAFDRSALPHTKNLFAVLDSDDVAAKDFNGRAMADAAAYDSRAAQSIVNDPSNIRYADLQTLGQLHAVIDSANNAELNDGVFDANAHAVEAWKRKGEWIKAGTEIAGHLPYVGPFAGDVGSILDKVFVGDQPAPLHTLTPEWRGFPAVQYPIVEALYQAGLGDTSKLAPLIDQTGNGLISYHDALDKGPDATNAIGRYLASLQRSNQIDLDSLWQYYTNAYNNGLTNGQPGVDYSNPGTGPRYAHPVPNN
jgi:hypothetical protein